MACRGWMTPAVWITSTVPAVPPANSPSSAAGSCDVADHDLDARAERGRLRRRW